MGVDTVLGLIIGTVAVGGIQLKEKISSVFKPSSEIVV